MTGLLLDEAAAIGDRLAREAVTHRGRCNWVTRTIPYRGNDGKDAFPELMTLNPSVYSGTAGVALFLGRLWRFTDKPEHREAALGAMRHAVRHAWYVNASAVGQIGARWRFGFYLGVLGIAWTANELGDTLGEATLVRDSRRLLRDLRSSLARPKDLDLMFGPAGAIPALLDLARRGSEDCLGLAERLGQELLATARQAEGRPGSSWPGPQGDKPDLTGLSHGTSGMALALSELYHATRDSDFLDGARRAVEYERGTFQDEDRNWPNFQSAADAHGHYACSTSWCHGAPGIGLARAAISRSWSDAAMRGEIETAAATTRAYTADELQTPGRDFMACHGVAGNLECLWELERARGHDATAEVRAAAALAVEHYGHPAAERWGPGIEWPLGVANGTYPTLVTGLAGIGHFLLRLHTGGTLPTVLLPGRSWRP